MHLRLEQGDEFECRNAEWIRNTLPYYEKIWEAFIGKEQSGGAKPLEMLGLTPELVRAREEFYQAHYSFTRKLFLLTELSKEIVDSIGEVRTYKEFEETEDRLFRYGSYLGYIFDMFDRMNKALNPLGSLHEELRSFYNQRHHIIHTPQIPHFIDCDGIFKIPRIAITKDANGQWHKSSVWSDFNNNDDFICLSEFVEETTDSFLEIVNKCHAKVFAAADHRFEKRRVKLDDFASPFTTHSKSLSTLRSDKDKHTDKNPELFTDNISGQYTSFSTGFYQ